MCLPVNNKYICDIMFSQIQCPNQQHLCVSVGRIFLLTTLNFVFQAQFEQLENEMKDSNANYEALMKSFLELTELKHILRKTQTFFEEVTTSTVQASYVNIRLSLPHIKIIEYSKVKPVLKILVPSNKQCSLDNQETGCN